MPRRNAKPSRFPDTRWSLVGRAAASDELTRQHALAELLRVYAPGLRAYLTEARRVPADLADDLLHDFIADKWLSRKLVHHARRDRGRFRNLVLKSLNNFVSSKLKKEYAARAMAGGFQDVHLAPSRPEIDRFEQEWVRQVVRDALRLMEEECRERSRPDLWTVFRLRVADPVLHEVEPAAYDDVVRELGIATPRQAMNLLANAKRCFDRHLRSAVGRYVPEDRIDDELADLREVVGR